MNRPDLVTRLNIRDEVLADVIEGENWSPRPYTWGHVNGSGDMLLVDSAIRGMFLHEGGSSEWHQGYYSE